MLRMRPSKYASHLVKIPESELIMLCYSPALRRVQVHASGRVDSRNDAGVCSRNCSQGHHVPPRP